MDFAKPNLNVDRYRALCFAAAFLYPAWWFSTDHFAPGSYDPFWQRLLVAVVVFLGGLGLKRLQSAAQADRLFFVMLMLFTGHNIFILYANHNHAVIAVGLMIAVLIIGLNIENLQHLIAYKIFVMAACVFSHNNDGPLSLDPLYLATCFGSISLVSLVLWHDRRAFRLKLQAHAGELRAVIDASLDHILWISADGLVSDYLDGKDSRAAKRPPPRFHETVESALAPELARAVRILLQVPATAGSDQEKTIEYEQLLASGERSVYEGHIIRAADGRVLVMIKDITHNVNDHLAMLQSEKMASLGMVAASIAHEVMNPLTVAEGKARQVARSLEAEIPDLEKPRNDIMVVQQAVERIVKIVKGLSTFTRDDSNDEMIHVGIGKIVEDTVILCRERLKNLNIRFSCSVISPDLNVCCRPVQISQVLINLINNAVDESVKTPDPWVSVEFETLCGIAIIAVANAGSPIPTEVQAKIFQSFFTTKPKGNGTGLGLSISRRIVELHSGCLSYDKSAAHPRFIVTLPIAQEPKVEAAA